MVEQATPTTIDTDSRIIEGLATIRACSVRDLQMRIEEFGSIEIDSREAAWVITLLEHELGIHIDAKRLEVEVLVDFRRLSRFVRTKFASTSS